MEKYVLDTNLFFNMNCDLGFGNKTEEVIKQVTQHANILRKKAMAELLVSPLVIEEILSFFEDPEQEFLKEFLGAVTIVSPTVGKLEIPAVVFQEYVDESRQRSYRGMTAAEETIQKTAQTFMGKEVLPNKEFQMTIGSFIKNFRERFRVATRAGYLDSLADLDLILLAKEYDAAVVSADEGVLRWARLIGVKEIPAPGWGERLRQLAQQK